MMGKKRATRNFAILGALTLFWGFGSSATAWAMSRTSTQPTLSGPHVVHWTHSAALTDPAQQLVSGVANSSQGCDSSYQTPLAFHLVSREVAYDPDSCQLIVETGYWTQRIKYVDQATPVELTDQAVEVSAPDPSATSTSAFQNIYPQGSTPPSANAIFDTQAWGHQWYQDPIGLHVVDVNSAMAFTTDPQCVYTAGVPGVANTVYHGDEFYEWFSASGWMGPTATSGQMSTVWLCSEDDVTLSNLVFSNNTFCHIPLPPPFPPIVVPVVATVTTDKISEFPASPPAPKPQHTMTASLSGWPCSLLLNYQNETGVNSNWWDWTQDLSERCITPTPPDPRNYDLPGWVCST